MKVSIKQAKDQLSELVRTVEGGQSVVLTRNGDPVCEIVPYKKRGGTDWETGKAYLKSLGVDRIATWVSPDFDDPLPEDFLITPLPDDYDKPKIRGRGHVPKSKRR